ncbi:MAG: hypothetical protein CMJ06_05055 [Pelagibacterales bacterium]|nr:hypothetical protein [Pelagibacterales bacterium]OUU61533.1 MAG: hypothetical protein CBC22_07120 [Alphaproteobacteria bacterium TMED62]|tara:strand:+ start:918 stop:1454 length:537 start_codon:yes stop_codon:yes gene_type:complete
MTDRELKKYKEELEKECKKNVPNFCKYASSKNAKILALLQDPGNSGAEDTRTCTVWENNDDTSKNQLKYIKKYKLDKKKEEILFWNFYGSFDLQMKNMKEKENIFWLKQTEKLLDLCPNVKVIIIFGTDAWHGMYYFKLKKKIYIIPSPHPSRRGMLQRDADARLDNAWKSAAKLILD